MKALGAGKAPDGLCYKCTVDLIQVDGPEQMILRVIGPRLDLYLRYVREKDGTWWFSGASPAPLFLYKGSYRVDRTSGAPYLVVSSEGDHGTGIEYQMESWFDLREPWFEPVLTFTVHGIEYPWVFGAGRDVRARVVPVPTGLRVLMTAKLMFLSMGVDIPCGTVAYHTVYRRAPGRRHWVSTGASPVDGKGPDISAKQFEMLAGVGEHDNEELMPFVLPALRRVVVGLDSEAKRALQGLVTSFPDRPEVRMIRDLMQ